MVRRICCFCEKWESGGIESFLTNTYMHMDLNKIEIDLVVACLEESIFLDQIKSLNINIIPLSRSLNKLLFNYRMFYKLLQRRKYDVIHLNIYHGLSLVYCWLAKKCNIPIRIVHSHNTDLRKSRSRSIKLIIHNLCKRLFSGVETNRWACSGSAAKFMFPQSHSYEFIPNGIKTELFKYDPEKREHMREELGINNKLVVGNIGRLCYQKNQRFLLDMLSELKSISNIQPALLLLVGDGEDLASLQEYSNKMGLGGNIMFYGTSNDIPSLLSAMDVFVFPSIFEGLGIAAVEAQCSGLPVLCSDTVPPEVGVTELINFLSLSAGALKWAETALEIAKTERKDHSKDVNNANFGIEAVASYIRNAYYG